MLQNVFLAVVLAAAVQGMGNVTVIGDSIASGYGLKGYVSGDDYSAAGSFGSLIREDCTEYANYAVDGRRSSELLAALSQANSEMEASIKSSDNVIISIGGNDFLKPLLRAVKTEALTDTEIIEAILNGEFKAEMITEYANKVLQAALNAVENVDVAATVENIRQITEKIHEINPDTEIILFTIYNPFHGNVLLSAAGEVADDKLAELNGGIKSLESDKIKIADIYEAFRGRESELTNINKLDIHPNAAGHAVIAEVIRKVKKIS